MGVESRIGIVEGDEGVRRHIGPSWGAISSLSTLVQTLGCSLGVGGGRQASPAHPAGKKPKPSLLTAGCPFVEVRRLVTEWPIPRVCQHPFSDGLLFFRAIALESAIRVRSPSFEGFSQDFHSVEVVFHHRNTKNDD